MAELRTKKTDASVEAFLDSVEDDTRREDAKRVFAMMKSITRAKPKMWGPTMVGFGEYHYTYASGREGDWFRMGFSPRKQNLTLYLMAGSDLHKDLLKKLGKHKLGKACLYINKLADVDEKVLKALLRASWKDSKS